MDRSDPDFDRLVAHYRPHVDAYVRRRIHHDAADDVVAETFATAWRRRAALPEDALPWLYATARNVVGTRYRSDARWVLLAQRLSAVPSEPAPDAAQQVAERDALVTAMATLGEDDRELVLLVVWDGLEVREAAASLGISPGAAATRLYRARARLRAALVSDVASHGPARSKDPSDADRSDDAPMNRVEEGPARPSTEPEIGR